MSWFGTESERQASCVVTSPDISSSEPKPTAFKRKDMFHTPRRTKSHNGLDEFTSDDICMVSDGVWVLSVNDVPTGYLHEENIEEVLWEAAKSEQTRLYLSGSYSHVYLEPVGNHHINIVGSHNYYVVSYERYLGSVTCSFTKKCDLNQSKDD